MAQRKQDLFGNVLGRITELPGAKGLIASVFVVDEAGIVTDHQLGGVFVR